jgi:hypothetical protein
VFETGTAGAAITAGQVLYYDSSAKTFKLADADGGTAAIASAYGIAVCSAASGQKVVVQLTGTVTLVSSASIAEGTTYMLSETPGSLASAQADLTSGSYSTTMGVGNGDDGLVLGINASGQQIPS